MLWSNPHPPPTGGEWGIQLIGALFNHQDRIELPIPHYGESIGTYHISNAAEQHKDGHSPNHQWSIHSTLCNKRNKLWKKLFAPANQQWPISISTKLRAVFKGGGGGDLSQKFLYTSLKLHQHNNSSAP